MTLTPDPQRELLTIKEAAARVHVCRRTIDNWIHRGYLQIERTVSGQPRIYADSLWRQQATMREASL
jgi:excisionase family DNA binding protein